MGKQLIDRENVLQGIEELKTSPFANPLNGEKRHLIQETLDIVACLVVKKEPTVEVEPIKHGKWWKLDNGICVCSKCGHWTRAGELLPNYCENCGAKNTLDVDVKNITIRVPTGRGMRLKKSGVAFVEDNNVPDKKESEEEGKQKNCIPKKYRIYDPYDACYCGHCGMYFEGCVVEIESGTDNYAKRCPICGKRVDGEQE